MSNFSLKDMDFRLPNVQGGSISLSDYDEIEAFVLIFTCNHCPYAIAYEERIKKLDESYTSQDIPLIAISSNDAQQYPQDSFERMKERASQKNFRFPYLYDEDQSVAKKYGATQTPHAFILAPQKDQLWQIVYSGALDDNYKNEHLVKKSYLKDALDSILAQKEISLAQTEPIGCTIKWRM